MVKALFDTNILIDYLSGIAQAKAELALYQDKAISIITWMEVQGGTEPHEQARVDDFLRTFETLPIQQDVAVQAVALRKKKNIKLPDAVIWATALASHRILISRNSKDFAANHPGVRIPYVL